MSSKKDLERLLCLSAFQNRCQRGIFCDSIHFFPPSEEVKNYLLSIQSSSSSAPPPAPAPVRSLSADEITANTSIIIIEPGSQPPPDEHPDLYDILLAQSRAIVTSSLSDPTSWVNLTPEGSNQPPRPLTPADISSMDRFTGNFLASDLDRDFSKTTTILLLASRDFVEKNAPQSVVDAVPLSYREALRGRLIVGTISYTSGEKFTAGGATGGSASAEDPAGSAIVMVRNLAVASWGRRMGFGRFLWNVAFLPAAQRQGYRSVTIHTTSNLGPALAFYSRIPALERNFGNKMLADGTIKKVYYDGPLAPVA
ncbi:hypothetical protein H696_01587 [Fonticula alba]|uniref:Uncharacterized protein n=1 Tax=Fonticula alba TaxID=691883 RepID=A0A058ZCP7_FONAL|nr:hypothetical protein H696_01587 [Fonticula alba]KCV72185.1 hypothetical protein H696_01587 [Fonticula alba]|eukprot:XP_009493763.1 hypothetical protein H696_01587 [Fonticula alba]